MMSRSMHVSEELEAQLASVLEQDGMTMATPEGSRRRIRRNKKRADAPTVSRSVIFEEGERPIAHDPIADLDTTSIDVMVRSTESAKEHTIPVQAREHARSAFVVSLRGVLSHDLSSHEEDRVPLQEVLNVQAPVAIRAHETAVYGTLSQDLAVESYDPHLLAEQFTPGEFSESYLAAYGHFHRIHHTVSVFFADVASLFQRIERIEQRVADEVQDTLHVVEVPRLSFARSLAGFAALSLIVTLPANAISLYRTASERKTAIEDAGSQALSAALAAKDAGSLPASEASLQLASSRFRDADAALTQSNALALGIASVLPKEYREARALLEVGDKSSEAGRLLAVAFDKIFHDPGRPIDERLDVLSAYARGVLPLLDDASKAAATISPDSLPADKRTQFTTLASQLETASQSVQQFAGMADLLSSLAGKEHLRRYLFIFQNQTELRPTGGFMGSMAEVTIDKGAIQKVVVPPGGTYDLKGQLTTHLISPAPLHLINADWQFQDANWSPDFPTSADKIRWFWSKSGGPTLDGVVALNASIVEKLLAITGPIDLPAYGKTIDSSNFMLETQTQVEIDYDHTANTPKKFVGDLMQAMLERMKTFTNDDWMKVAALVSNSLESKDIQISLTDPSEQSAIASYGWSGQMKETDGDSLALIEANIAGQKTDGVISETANLVADIQDDGSIIDTVTLTRTHHGQKGTLFSGVRNVSYLRTYVPQGSQLLDASGFAAPSSTLFKKPQDDDVPDPDISAIEAQTHTDHGIEATEEGSRSVFGGWLQLDPGQTQTITVRYRVPFTIQDLDAKFRTENTTETAEARAAYLVLLTSQSGKSDRELTATVHIPTGWTIAWKRGESTTDSSGLELQTTWDHDTVMAALLAPPKVSP